MKERKKPTAIISLDIAELLGWVFSATVYGMLCSLRFYKSKLDHRLFTGAMEDSGLQEGSGPAALT